MGIGLISAAFALPMSVFGADKAAARPPSPPNVLLVLVDDMGYGDLGCHGNLDVETPAIDGLWAESTRLTRYYSQPVCTPTRASLMTGRYHFRTRAINTLYGSQMDPDEVTMAEMFRAAGYRTGIFGKWHLGDNYPVRAIDQGFDEAVTHRGGGMAHWFDRPGSSYFDPVLELNGRSKAYEGYCDDIFFREATGFVERHRNEPFFCFVSTPLPHDPLMAPPERWLPFHERGINEENAIIYGMMKNVDENIRRLLQRLEALGLAENTIVIFTSDNGPAMQLSEHQARYNADLRGEKKQVYEGGIRSPLFIRWPGRVQAGRDIDRIASMNDLLPTLAEACGVSTPRDVQIDGKSLLPLLLNSIGPERWPDRTLFFQCYPGVRKKVQPELYFNSAARTQRWKLVGGEELYDLEADPAEAHDVAAQHPRVVAELRRQYENWFEDVCSTRGFDPPLIILGTDHENPTVLNQRDWRLEEMPARPKPAGHAARLAALRPELMGRWAVQVARPGEYRITCSLKDKQFAPAELHFQLGDVHLIKRLEQNARKVAFDPVTLPAGTGKLKVWYSAPGRQPAGLAEVEIERLKL